ncbi:hypothetical protein K493DRAFT_280588 [Basidiobolus meristosporus CBS 931.73]|uniref:RNA polymerase II subunit A C-terminal domain phosphatase n=1 Tax=Basidiobolus meristosporus CBS 931.73 TaxID=1314790 RepID=A0A1Y1YJW6_9FUNG|nr:hypothetical protein K493DRAFT_280588 [Basidiobolus meristosporus CBS 931.73]|eukprot:ORX98278.1 hypothetical protein K493DRAFT_280588 [Basidiobolus meristosporus CBS 931.73]
METIHDIFIPEDHLPATIISYKVSSHEAIKKHQPICLYQSTTHEDTQEAPHSREVQELTSPFEGTILAILTTVGEEITKKGRSILTVKEPNLQEGSRAEQPNIPGAEKVTPHIPQDFKDADQVDTEGLLKSRKLSLIVDLDQTIIHTTVDSIVEDWIHDKSNADNPAIHEISNFILPDSLTMFYIKLRPGLKEFLREITQLYDLHIYTMGSSSYAEAVALAIDPNQEFFKEKILSRDENEEMTQKTIQRLFPYDTSMVVIIDDRGDVWEWSPNLIRVKPYEFFADYEEINDSFLSEPEECKPSGATEFSSDPEFTETPSYRPTEQVMDEHKGNPGSNETLLPNQAEERPMPIDNDTELFTLLKVLKAIHRSFYNEYTQRKGDGMTRFRPGHPDVKSIIASMKHRVLKNTNLVFSGIIPVGCDPTTSDIWSLARMFGAQCSTNLNNQVTHVVASKPGTAKVNHAQKMPHVLIVKLEWLLDSISHWERQDEKSYLIHDAPPPRISLSGFDRDGDTGSITIDPNEMNEHMLRMDWSDAAREVEECLGDSDFNTVTSEPDSEREEDGEDKSSYRKRKVRDFLRPEGRGFINAEEIEQSGIKRMRALRANTSPLKYQINFMEDDVFESQSDVLNEHQSDGSGNNSSSEAEEAKEEEEVDDDIDFLEDFSREIEEELSKPETPAPAQPEWMSLALDISNNSVTSPTHIHERC